jgi:hypothetical protein
MRDAGLPSRREKNKLAVAMAKTVQDRMMTWTEENFSYFEQTMEMIREGAPVQWTKLYMDAVKLGLDKTTNINININRQQDRENLQALVRTRISLPDAGTYTPYEEIKPKEPQAVVAARQKIAKEEEL